MYCSLNIHNHSRNINSFCTIYRIAYNSKLCLWSSYQFGILSTVVRATCCRLILYAIFTVFVYTVYACSCEMTGCEAVSRRVAVRMSRCV